METRASRAACSKRLHTRSSSRGILPLLSLPRELLQLVLARVDPSDLRALVECSKAMAQQVVQRNSRQTTLRVPTRPGKNWAATRRLLQWAAPAGLVLTMPWDCFAHKQYEDFNSMMGGKELCPAMPGLQLLFLTEMCLQGFELPWVVPPGVADACPNLFTLELNNCTVTSSSDSSDTCSTGSSDNCNYTVTSNDDSSDSSSSNTGSTASKPAAPSICHLRLRGTILPQLGGAAYVRVFAKQLSDSLPSLTCLEVEHDDLWLDEVLPQLVSLWATQLTDVYAYRAHWSDWPRLLSMGAVAAGLNKLIMPYRTVSGTELPALLQLQHLTHLELSTFSRTTDDLSSHACTWQHLHLHLLRANLELRYLLNVPLHSLQQPLLLGHPSARSGPTIKFPQQASAQELSRWQRLADQLVMCGVQMLPNQLAYQAEQKLPGDLLGPTVRVGAVLPVISAAFGAAQQVTIHRCILDHQAIQALGLAHQHRLQQLTLLLHLDPPQFYPQPSWEGLLTHLPGLEAVVVLDLWPRGWQAHLHELIPKLSAAMAQQPAGRCVEVYLPNSGSNNQDVAVMDWVTMLMKTYELTQAGVEITARFTMSSMTVVTATRAQMA